MQDFFSTDKLRALLKKSGADNAKIKNIIVEIKSKLYDGISTTKIYLLFVERYEPNK